MNIVGIGTDIESIDRFNLDLDKDKKFLNKLFTASELDYCFSKATPAQHLAGKFCAKEAVIKALGNIKGEKLSYKDIEIVSAGNAPPNAVLPAFTEDVKVMLSISHCEDKALAFAVVVSE